MKNIIYILLGLLLLGCQKEDAITSKIVQNNLYTITDNLDDSIQHKVYKIYETYGIPVYFNDTIGKTFVKINGQGDSVFIWEKLDLNWQFSTSQGYTYQFFYMKDPAKQSVMLDIIDEYLATASKALQPFAILVTDSAYAVNKKNLLAMGITRNVKIGNKVQQIQGMYVNYGFRSMFFAGFQRSEGRDTLIPSIMKAQISNKLANYKKEVDPFYLVSKKSWYQVKWNYLDSKVAANFSSQSVTDSITYWANKPSTPLNQRAIIAAQTRSVMGPYGFVGRSKKAGSNFTPDNENDDLNSYLVEMLRWPRATFISLWGDYPLVMKKYEILYDVIANKMEVEL